jgi:hypothetical protein
MEKFVSHLRRPSPLNYRARGERRHKENKGENENVEWAKSKSATPRAQRGRANDGV